MRKWLIILLVLVVAIVGTLWWLGSSLDKDKPADDEIRMRSSMSFRRFVLHYSRRLPCPRAPKLPARHGRPDAWGARYLETGETEFPTNLWSALMMRPF